MLRFLFWTLVVANGVLFAFHQGYLDSSQEKKEPQRLLNQLNPDKFKLLPVTEAKPAEEPAQPPPATTTAASPPAPEPAPQQAAPQAPPQTPTTPAALTPEPQKTLACVEIGDFSPAEAKRVEQRLSRLSLGNNLSRIQSREVASHMVYIPSLGSKAAADAKVAELQKLGISNFFVIQDAGPYRWSISLGIFKSEDAAKHLLADLNRQGVQGVRIGPRSVTAGKTAFRLRKLDPSSVQAVNKIMTDFPQQRKHECGRD